METTSVQHYSRSCPLSAFYSVRAPLYDTRKDPGHQGVSLSNLLTLDGGWQPGHRAQVKLEAGLVQLEGLGADLTLRLEGVALH
jgi:hypothetical protein